MVEAIDVLLDPDGNMPDFIRIFVDGQHSTDQRPEGPFYHEVRRAGTWVLKALCAAHTDPAVKAAARRLLATAPFTVNLEWAGRFFSTTLRPGLHAQLMALGEPLSVDFDAQRHGEVLNDATVLDVIGWPSKHPIIASSRLAGRPSPTQIDLLPSDPSESFIKFAEPWTFPEDVYSHAMLMVAAAINETFQAGVGEAVRFHGATYFGGDVTAKHTPAAPKALSRVLTKAAADYRGRPNPVAQNNVDVVRCLVSVDTPTELLHVTHQLSTQFGGIVRFKNLFTSTPTDRASRFHMLSLMLTVVADGGATYGRWVKEPRVKDALQRYIDMRDRSIPPHRWAETTAAAHAMLCSEELRDVPVRLLGEIQVLLTAHMLVRDQMHEVYKAYRAETATLLYADFARVHDKGTGPPTACGADLPSVGSLWEAASKGNRPALERFLQSDPIENINVQQGAHFGRTPLYAACDRGFTDIVKVLLDVGADVEIGTTDNDRTPLYVAAQRGHTAIVRMLLDSADPNHPKSDTGATPLSIAAASGFYDVVQVLLDNGALADLARTDTGMTPLHVAAEHGHVDVVRILLGAGANIGAVRTDCGLTALCTATQEGHAAVVQLLKDAGAVWPVRPRCNAGESGATSEIPSLNAKRIPASQPQEDT